SLSGQISLGNGTLSLTGITLGVLNLPAAGPFSGGAVTIKADLVFTGIVPEPGTAALFGAGLLGLAARGRPGRSCTSRGWTTSPRRRTGGQRSGRFDDAQPTGCCAVRGGAGGRSDRTGFGPDPPGHRGPG